MAFSFQQMCLCKGKGHLTRRSKHGALNQNAFLENKIKKKSLKI